jgi:hypothetical protein
MYRCPTSLDISTSSSGVGDSTNVDTTAVAGYPSSRRDRERSSGEEKGARSPEEALGR